MKLFVAVLLALAVSTEGLAQSRPLLSFGRCGMYSLGESLQQASKTAEGLGCKISRDFGVQTIRDADSVRIGSFLFIADELISASRNLFISANDSSPSEAMVIIFRSLTNLNCAESRYSLESSGLGVDTSVRTLRFHCRDRFIETVWVVTIKDGREVVQSLIISETIRRI